ncbi:MAG: NifX-associated nitrogen fixation protein [Gammaproteobacteria bacterium]|jgi:probable nitrogen fixation protein
MTEAAAVIVEDDALLASDFAREMVRQMRAIDTYGTYDEWPVAKILKPFVLTKQMRREIPVVGDPDEVTLSRVSAFYNAIAALIEAHTGKMAVPVVHLSHEGFGRALITVGKLVVMDRTLRDVHRFGFPELAKMKEEADKLVSRAVELVENWPEVAKL